MQSWFDNAQRVDVSLGVINSSIEVVWPTRTLYRLPAVSNQRLGRQIFPNEAIRDLKRNEKLNDLLATLLLYFEAEGEL